MVKIPIYLDNNATTKLDPRVLEAMMPYFTEIYGNAASRNHVYGWKAEEGVDWARNTIAKYIGADEKEIVFTSGATESNNLAIKGVAEMYASKGNHIITCTTEHKAVLDTCKALERKGVQVTYMPVNKEGFINLDLLRESITDKTILVTIMHANNEIGVIQDIEAIGKICHEKGVLFHTDATQSIGKVPFDAQRMNVDLASMSGHKIYGPKGVGALYVRKKNPRVKLASQMDGGGHERGMRSGTLNVAGIVGLAKALELCITDMPVEVPRIQGMRDRLWKTLTKELDEIYINGPDPLEKPQWRLPGNLNVSFAFVEGEAMMMGIKDIAVSSGSACTSASLEPSYILKALGVGEDLAHTSIRFGIGRFNTEEEIDYTAAEVIKAVRHLREMSPLYEMAKQGIDLKSVAWAAH
ncbi:MAG: IscS subfamily cysteine desulfurase [Bacteroidota bacterium]|nr:IscS subfamily cysteine desulfurase [Bacteroidota bacterium]MDP4230762.1 IscS subfamily cysteine desulfurase [Bacteroidota bacterium]MDP4236442.1 IscS subfamily cysteine desulfurase [Bacteroidota bacterium]